MLQCINYGSFEEKNSTSILAYFVIIVLFSHYIEADKVKGNCSLHHQTKNPIEKFEQEQNCYCLSPQCLKLEHNNFVDLYCPWRQYHDSSGIDTQGIHTTAHE